MLAKEFYAIKTNALTSISCVALSAPSQAFAQDEPFEADFPR